jgi:hypothetical protein
MPLLVLDIVLVDVDPGPVLDVDPPVPSSEES